MTPRVAFITNLSPYYRRPLFAQLADRLAVTYFFFSEADEPYLGSSIRHDPDGLPVKRVRRISVAGNPVLVGLDRELHLDRYDVVVKCINGRLMLPYTFNLASRRGMPFVLWTGIWRHPTTAFHRLSRPLTERIYRGSDAIVTYGAHVKDFVTRVRDVNPEKAFVAGQATDLEPFAELNSSTGIRPPRVVFIGRLEQAKGVEDLLEAFSSMPPDVRLRIVGRGPLDELVRSHAARDSRIEIAGAVEHAAIPEQLEGARCLVLPSITTKSFREPWGLVVNEAMGAGVPVVATEAVGAVAGGLVRDLVNGLVVPERDPEALATALRTLIEDADLAASLGAEGRRDVASFSYSRMAQAFVDATEYAVAKR